MEVLKHTFTMSVSFGNSGPPCYTIHLSIIPVIILTFSQTKMSTSDNNSHKEKEEKTDPSAMKKQPEMEERESGNSELEQLEDSLINLSIQVTEERLC